LALILSLISAPWTLNSAASTANPAIVLAAFGTTTAAFDTYDHFEQKVKERFPGYEIRWAFTSHKVRHKVAREKGQQQIDALHLLLALVSQEESVVLTLAQRLGLDMEGLKKKISFFTGGM